MRAQFKPVIAALLLVIVALTTCSAPVLRTPEEPQAAVQSPAPLLAKALPAAEASLPADAALPTQPAVIPAQLPVEATAEPVATTAVIRAEAAPVLPADSAPTTIIGDQRVADAADAYLNEQVAAGNFNGTVLVARNGKILFAKGYGMANAEQNLVNSPRTRFRLGSITKQFTAAAIMMLQQEGKLHIGDPICNYFANCPAAWQPITIHHLLTHTSGLPNYTDFADFEETEPTPTTPDELISRFRDLPLNFAPGTVYSYCNSNYVVLGAIIEQISGESYEQFLHERIFTPLGMQASGYDHPDEPREERAVGYLQPGELASYHDMSTLFAAGALYSTVGDLLAWDQALYSEELLPQSAIQEMFTPYMNQYGYGWKIGSQYDRRVVSHPGLVTGFSTYIARYIDDRVTVIVLSNMQYAPAEQIGVNLAGIVFGG